MYLRRCEAVLELSPGWSVSEPWVLILSVLIRRYIGALTRKNIRASGLSVLKERKNRSKGKCRHDSKMMIAAICLRPFRCFRAAQLLTLDAQGSVTLHPGLSPITVLR